ncbi:hypothetical protein K439DRAFT_1329778, partial [Ramaria rubella]
SLLRILPSTFDALLSKIEHHPVFQNNSDNQQIPVISQLAVVLYRFGHFGNAASMQKVGPWAGLRYGTVDKCTQRVMKAVCDESFRRVVMRWLNEHQKEEASRWVESQSCPGWCGGWLMVNGTLVPLFSRPGFYGNSWYDRKSNYSLNVQLISMPDLRIINYGVGLPGSQHDATVWKGTRIPREHDTLLGRDEWVWADTAYPLQRWCQAPYKKYVLGFFYDHKHLWCIYRPEKDIAENGRYNYFVSRVRVRSEHCVGFLKGQWFSLHGLWLHINNPSHICFAVIWVMACIVLHNFAILHEAEEHEGIDVELSDFFREGLGLLEEEQRIHDGRNTFVDQHMGSQDTAPDMQLTRGHLRREELKHVLFEYMDH